MPISDERMTRGEMLKGTLMILGLLGILSVAVVCPNLLQLVPKSYRGRYRSQAIRQAVLRLDKHGWIIARQTTQGWRIQITEQGRRELLAYEIGEKHLKKPKQWDQKWHLLIFDIPEKRRDRRDHIRRFLQSLNFQRLQDSVWAYPYECREVLNLLRTKYGVQSEALYVRVDSLDRDRWLRRHFGLK